MTSRMCLHQSRLALRFQLKHKKLMISNANLAKEVHVMGKLRLEEYPDVEATVGSFAGVKLAV